jgi:hypothetical protein
LRFQHPDLPTAYRIQLLVARRRVASSSRSVSSQGSEWAGSSFAQSRELSAYNGLHFFELSRSESQWAPQSLRLSIASFQSGQVDVRGAGAMIVRKRSKIAFR